jgi:hypothetical protein
VSNPVIKSLLSRLGEPDLLKKLDSLPASELNSLLLEVMRLRTLSISAGDLMHAYQQNRFVAPSSIDPVTFLKEEIILLELAKSHGYEALELSPLAPLGNCSVMGLANQNKIVSALRGTEVVADATNLMALESSLRRKESTFDSSIVNLCAVHRHVRSQALPPGKGFTPHFKIFCLLSAGADHGHLSFEKNAILSHLLFYKSYFVDTLQLGDMSVIVKGLTGEGQNINTSKALYQHVSENVKEMSISFIEVPADEHRYYHHTRFSINIDHNGSALNLGDGGFVDWAQKLTSNSKEQMFTSGIGLELLIKLQQGLL